MAAPRWYQMRAEGALRGGSAALAPDIMTAVVDAVSGSEAHGQDADRH